MKKSEPLFLPEEVLLLALRDEEGTIAGGTMWRFALGGAALAELLLAERIRVDSTRKRPLVDLVSAKPLGDPFLDECLERVRTAKRRASTSNWVSRFAQAKNLKHRIAEGLCRRGVLRMKEDQVFLLFTRRVYPERAARFEEEVLERLHRAVFTEARDLDPRTVVLVSIADRTGLLRANIDKKRLRSRKKRIQAIIDGEACGAATKSAIDAMVAAVVVTTVIVPTVIT